MATAVLPPTPFAANLYWQQTPRARLRVLTHRGQAKPESRVPSSAVLLFTGIIGQRCVCQGGGAVGGENRGDPCARVCLALPKWPLPTLRPLRTRP